MTRKNNTPSSGLMELASGNKLDVAAVMEALNAVLAVAGLKVTVNAALPAGTNNIGDVDIASALPAGTNNIGDVDVASIAAGANTIGSVGVVRTGTIEIADGQSLSTAAIPKLGAASLGLIFPAGMEGTTITFQVSTLADSGFVNLYDPSGLEVSATVAASRALTSDSDLMAKLMPWPYIKVRTGTAASGTAQTGAATITYSAIG